MKHCYNMPELMGREFALEQLANTKQSERKQQINAKIKENFRKLIMNFFIDSRNIVSHVLLINRISIRPMRRMRRMISIIKFKILNKTWKK